MLETADVTRQFLQSIIRIIGRKTSEEYAAVSIRNLLKKLQMKHSFIREMTIRDTRFLELESSVAVQDSINAVDPKKVGNALKDLIKIIIESMGKTAGYFFIRELREKIGNDYDIILKKTMDVDLTLLQSTFVVEKKTINLLQIEKSDLIRRLLKTFVEILEKKNSKASALEFIAARIESIKQHYPFFSHISVNDIRYTLGADDVIVHDEINTIDSQELGKAIQSFLWESDTALTAQGQVTIIDELKTHLTTQYLSKLQEMGVNLAAHGVGYDSIIKQVIKTMIEVLGKTSTENYAIFAVNSFLRKTDTQYEFLKSIKVDSSASQGEDYHITMMNTLESFTDTDARRAIQKLLEAIVASLGEKLGNQFIQDFKNSLEKKYLSRIEEIGVNLHMIELHSEMAAQTES